VPESTASGYLRGVEKFGVGLFFTVTPFLFSDMPCVLVIEEAISCGITTWKLV